MNGQDHLVDVEDQLVDAEDFEHFEKVQGEQELRSQPNHSFFMELIFTCIKHSVPRVSYNYYLPKQRQENLLIFLQ
ncbi:hypothetical protein H5410_050500 [Solanum commersonii]|uniref:Uncharacterized protein n=1 Tax=Solanum commersonii TaxID=4109 RepID=A0A9J5WVM5_SOLCO|nr:hypothetical protein H5410_050500 [Solanum commersonii]